MKFRNKETGKTRDFEFVVITKDMDAEFAKYAHHAPVMICRSIDQLNEEWEDYVPKEPLLDFYDERKLVRHWAEVHNIKEVWVRGIGNGKEVVEIYDVEDGLMRLTLYRPEKVVLDKPYTIAELCGEEEE